MSSFFGGGRLIEYGWYWIRRAGISARRNDGDRSVEQLESYQSQVLAISGPQEGTGRA